LANRQRKRIPENTQKELWARAAGRCEFRGCNKLVIRDGLTKQASNLSVISHIVAAEPGGPRGDEVRSALLCTDIQNLMLTCRDHGKLVDDKSRVEEYTKELLLEFKGEHEERIQRLTGIAPDAQSRIIILQAPVSRRPVTIREREVVQALLPRYPADEHAYVWDLNAFGHEICEPGVVDVAANALQGRIDELRRVQQRDAKHLSVFALAPIPFLVFLGRKLGDTDDLDAYQRHRATSSWAWPEDEKPEEYYRLLRSEPGGTEAVVLLSISGQIDRSLVNPIISSSSAAYEIRARRRGVDFLKSRARLDAFALQARQLMGELHELGVTKVQVFAAAPSPAAIEFGRAARQMNGELLVYEYDEGTRSYGTPLSVSA
jgi:SMODS-associated and fused to various effectors sensor domain